MPTIQTPIAYFSMEIALDVGVPTYAGGLGVLAGDTVRSAADLAVPFVAVSLLHRRGYFQQNLDEVGQQTERPVGWRPEDYLEPLEPRVSLEMEGRTVTVRGWRRRVIGVTGASVPVILLDTDVAGNDPADRRLTDVLYGGDDAYRLRQEVVLGVAGVRLLRALGHGRLHRLHLNEGHAALAVVALLEERSARPPGDLEKRREILGEVRRHCVFTTHTPVPAGHDQFPAAMARRVLSSDQWQWIEALGDGASLNLTDLALRASRFVNGVAMRHGEVSRGMFPQYPIRSITNGVHPATWAAPSFQRLFDRHVPDWRRDAFSLRYAVGFPSGEIADAHAEAKRALLARVRRETGARLDPHALVLGFARRATAYKRATLVFRDPERLCAIARDRGPLQLVFAGKAHPHDEAGKALIREVYAAARALAGRVAVAWLPDYDMELGRLLTAGSDVWLNTPTPPLEASGTSGMKAALNGVPSFSVLDGWWVEGCVEGVTGWAVGRDGGPPSERRDAADAEALYAKLADEVLTCFYRDPERFLGVQRSCIALNASFFNTQRMVLEYLYEAYRDEPAGG